MYVIITCKYEKDQIKDSREKVETPFSHYIPMGIFSDFQGQLTLQSVVQSSQNSNLFELSCMSSLPATVEKKWTSFFLFYYKPMGIFRRSRAANSSVGGPIRLKFKLVRALMHVFVTCKYEKDEMKTSREK